MIAKTMSFLQGDKAVLILTEGTAKSITASIRIRFAPKPR